MKLKGCLDSTIYQQVLEGHMLTDTAALTGDDFVFQQNNAPIHTSRSTRHWLHQHDVTVLDWPPKSSDANPIENLWHEIKTAAIVANQELQLSSGMLYKRHKSRLQLRVSRTWQKVFHNVWTQAGGREEGTLSTEELVKGFNFPSHY